jgi:hypothetical protein
MCQPHGQNSCATQHLKATARPCRRRRFAQDHYAMLDLLTSRVAIKGLEPGGKNSLVFLSSPQNRASAAAG